MRWLLAVAVVVPLTLLGACQTSTSSTHPASTIHDPVDRSHITELDARVSAAILLESLLPPGTRTPVRESDRVGYQLLPQCQDRLPTDDRIVTEDGAAWSSRGAMPLIDQWVIAYDRPVAAAAVASAKTALSCKSSGSRDGKMTVTSDGTFTVHGVPDALGYCERLVGARQAYRCTVVVAASDLACSVRAWDLTKDAAQSLVRRLVPPVLERCR